MGENYQINITGSGQLNADAVAVGTGAKAVSHGSSRELRDEIRQLLEEVREAVRDGELAEEVAHDAEELVEATEADNPDETKVRGLLDKISSAVQPVGALATTVSEIQGAVGALFG